MEEPQFTLASEYGEARRMGLTELVGIIEGSSVLDDSLSEDPGYYREKNTRRWLLSLPPGTHTFGYDSEVMITVH